MITVYGDDYGNVVTLHNEDHKEILVTIKYPDGSVTKIFKNLSNK